MLRYRIAYKTVSVIASEWNKVCSGNLWTHSVIPGENRSCHSSQYQKNLHCSFKYLSESGTVTPDRRKNYCHGIIIRRAVPGLRINNGGKGKYDRSTEYKIEYSWKNKLQAQEKHFSQNWELHATFRLIPPPTGSVETEFPGRHSKLRLK